MLLVAEAIAGLCPDGLKGLGIGTVPPTLEEGEATLDKGVANLKEGGAKRTRKRGTAVGTVSRSCLTNH